MKGVEEVSDSKAAGFKRANSMLESLPQSEEELEAIRHAVFQKEGLIPMLFDLMRRMPRRVLMILKLNDLTRCEISVEFFDERNVPELTH